MDNYLSSFWGQQHEVEYIISSATKHEFASKQEVYLKKMKLFICIEVLH